MQTDKWPSFILGACKVRAARQGLSHAVASAIFGGSAQYVSLWREQAGGEAAFYGYVTAMCAIASLVSFHMRDSSKKGNLRNEP